MNTEQRIDILKRTQERDEFLRKRAERQRKIRKRRIRITFFIFIFLLICVGAILSLTVFFPIKNIDISGSSVYSSAELQKASGINIGDNLFVVSGAQVESSLKTRLPYVESIELKRKLPDTLIITVTDADKYACYSTDGKNYLVSRSGWVLEEIAEVPADVFAVIGANISCEVGSKAEFSEENSETLVNTIADSAETLGLKLNSVDIGSSVDLTLKVEGRFNVNLGTSNNLEEKLKHLKGMIKTMSEEQSGRINLSMWTANNPQGTFIPEILE